MKQKKYRIYTCVFAVLFFSLSIVCWLKPADAFSVTERRPLDQFPTLNVNTLLNGSFMSKFEEYTLDQFPLRDDRLWQISKFLECTANFLLFRDIAECK